MAYGLYPWDGSSYSGAAGAMAGGASITDPANPALPGYKWTTQAGPGAWGQTAYSGGGIPASPANAGLQVVPDNGSANVRLTAWWSGAGYLRINRVLADGTRVPVRGAYPITVPSPTRWNLCTNPSFEVDTSGWLAGSNTSFTYVQNSVTLTGLDYLTLTATAAGSVTATAPVTVPTGPFGVSLNLRLPALPTGALTASVAWTSQNGVAMGSTSATIASGNFATYQGRWARTPVLTINPPGQQVTGTSPNQVVQLPANGVLTISIAGMAAGGTADIDGVLVEAGSGTSGVYFDGDTSFGSWQGTAGLSVSSLATPQTVTDDEPPFDQPFQYELTAPNQPGNRILTDLVTLDSLDQTWLSHPTLGALPIHVTTAPQLTATIKRGIYEVVGRSHPIAVAANLRQAQSGSLQLYAEDLGIRDRIVALLEDGQPLLIRMPADYGYNGGWWMSIGDVVEDCQGPAWGPRYLTLPFTVVDAPAVV